MPIIIKDFTWTQSESKICINLPLKGTKANNLDILNSLDFIKVSFPPFLFECWLYDTIQDEEGSAIVNNGIISLRFSKQEEKLWPNLFHTDHENKELVKEVRENAIKFAGERVTRMAEQKAKDIAENKKMAIKEQMKLEEQERSRIEAIKESERVRATNEIERFKQLASPADLTKIVVKQDTKQVNIESKTIFDESKENIPSVSTERQEANIPLPRSSGSIQIKFTPRVFPTPSRESQDKMEKEWLANQAEARKLTDLSDELKDLNENETNLDWLKEKAGNLYKQENYQTAIGVYNHAIRLFPKEASLYSNRAACHYKVRNLIKCVEDCTRALEFLTPPVEANATSRLKCHVRRGTAFCELELYAEGLLDYDAAIKIDPDNKELIADAENIRKIIVGTPPDLDTSH